MKFGRFASTVLTIVFVFFCTAVRCGWAAEKVSLDRVTVVVDSSEPSFVQYGVEELAGYLKEAKPEMTFR